MTRRTLSRTAGNNVERMLVYGSSGVGKTWGALQHVDGLIQRGWKGTLWCADPEDGVEKQLKLFSPDLEKHIAYEQVNSFNESEALLAEAVEKGQRGDWFMAEMAGKHWDLAQQYWVQEVYGQGLGEYLEASRKLKAKSDKGKDAPDLDQLKDWLPIKKIHNRFMDGLIPLNAKGINVIVTAEADKLVTEGKRADAQDVQDLFYRVGYKPSGEKRNVHRFHTVLYLTRSSPDRWHVSVPKNRGPQVPDFDCPIGTSYIDAYQRISGVL